MGKPFTIQEQDDAKLEDLKNYFCAPSKVAVLRMALELLEKEKDRQEKAKQWAIASMLVKKSSGKVNAEFRRHASGARKVI